MHVLYGLHTIAWASMGTLAVIALIVNYIKRADEHDAVYVSHHNYMIATFWWTVLWLVVTGPLWLLLFLPGASPTRSSGSGTCTAACAAGCASPTAGYLDKLIHHTMSTTADPSCLRLGCSKKLANPKILVSGIRSS